MVFIDHCKRLYNNFMIIIFNNQSNEFKVQKTHSRSGWWSWKDCWWDTHHLLDGHWLNTASSSTCQTERDMRILVAASIFLLFCICTITSASFYIIFQDVETLSKEQYMEYTKSIPDLTDFSICYWEKLHRFNSRETCLFAFCSLNKKEKMQCRAFKYGTTEILQVWADTWAIAFPSMTPCMIQSS